ncbi:hypothetical protein CFSAN001081_07807, partial [Salmonella enterica subsp. enterica serovar London str. CFSAN001081]
EKEVNKTRGKAFFFKFITIPCLGNNAKRNVFKTNLKKSKLSFLVVDCFFRLKNKALDSTMLCFYRFMLSQGRENRVLDNTVSL